MDERLSGREAFVEGHCKICKDVTRHKICLVQDGKLKEVQCGSCHDLHKFKPPPPSKAERQRIAAERQKAKLREEDREKWERIKPKMIEAKAKDYSMDGLFRKKDVIRHPQFGLGMVERKAGHRKVEVLFEDGRKIMRCH